MSYSNQIYSQAREIVASRRAAALAEAQEKKTAFIVRHPEYERMEKALSRTGYELALTIFRDGNGSAAA